MKKITRIAATAALFGTTACAPGLGIGPQIGATAAGLSSAGPCYMYGDGLTALAFASGPRFWGMRQQSYALQSRFMAASSDIRVQMSSWKEVARGC